MHCRQGSHLTLHLVTIRCWARREEAWWIREWIKEWRPSVLCSRKWIGNKVRMVVVLCRFYVCEVIDFIYNPHCNIAVVVVNVFRNFGLSNSEMDCHYFWNRDWFQSNWKPQFHIFCGEPKVLEGLSILSCSLYYLSAWQQREGLFMTDVCKMCLQSDSQFTFIFFSSNMLHNHNRHPFDIY